MKIILRFAGGVSQVDLDALLAIQARGAVVTYEKYQPITPSDFARLHGMHPGSVTRLLKKPHCPKIHGRIGPSGRVVNFLPTTELSNFLLEHRRK